jgi:hypothetical protein
MLLLPHRRRPVNPRLAYAIIILFGLLLDWRIAYGHRSGWGLDFNQFYAASHLAGTGHLYDWGALQHEELKNGLVVHAARLPIVAYGAKVISWLPYDAAHWLWVISSAAALVLTVLLWPGGNRPVLFVALAWSWSAALLLLLGQDTPFWLLFFAAGFALLQRGRTTLAGVVLALCLCKFHLAGCIPVILLARRAWRTLLAGAGTTAVLLGACFLVEGPRWTSEFMAVFREPMLSPVADRMPNLRGIAYWTPQPVWTQAALMILFAILLLLAARKVEEIGTLAALGAACGLLLGPQGYGNNCVLLLPLAGLYIADKAAPQWLRIWSLLIITPVPLLLLASDKPLAGQLLIAGFVAAGLATNLFIAKPAESPDAVHFH